MSAIEVIARPVFGQAESERLVDLCRMHAPGSGAPQFALALAGAAAPAADIVRHVEAVGAATPRINFCLRSALVVPELPLGRFHVILVPEEGFGAIVRLHDRLHVGPLADALSRDMPYIPHLLVASAAAFDPAHRIKAVLNAEDLAISGRIDAIEVRESGTAAPRVLAAVALAHQLPSR